MGVWFEDHLIILPFDWWRLQDRDLRLNLSVAGMFLFFLFDRWLNLVRWLVLFSLTIHVALNIQLYW